MVITSDQISALAGNFQAQTMGQMQHASMISQQVGGQSFGQGMMGSMVNKGAGIGGPMMAGAMGLAGIDPMSMGIKGAIGGFGRAGMMGAVGGGMAAAGAVAAPMMAAQYVGGQMMTGMQQQQQVGASLGQGFQFQNRHGGQGFTSSQSANIGQFLRTQAQQGGPGGEMATMGEMTRMAGMMGQMGMGRGVRDVKDFTDKFRAMMKEVKEIATAFNSTLEEAQQIMGSMKQSGIFTGQGKVAKEIRGVALASGLATEEITSAMNVGSQISGAIGGRRKSGAMAGMKNIAQIGMAQQAGILTEEDIFQQTGQTGAAGRAAMAQSRLSRSASFLKSGLGRRVLASMAGKEGMLDEESAEEFGLGGTSTGGTMGAAGRNLGRVGRASFIRNEGRLRGEVLKKFGGSADVTAMAGWLESRGMDLNSDRAKIFMQRRLKMNADELDNEMKMYHTRDFTESRREGIEAQADASKRLKAQKAGGGLKGIKRKFEKARDDVQNYLQQKGADFYTESSNLVDRWANELTGEFMTDMQENLESSIRAVRQGGAMGRLIGKRKFGLDGGVGGRGLQDIAKQFQQDMMGGEGMSDVRAFKQSGDLERFQKAGYRIRGGGTDEQLKRNIAGVRGLQGAYQEGTGDERYGALGKSMAEELQSAVAFGGMEGKKGVDATAQFMRILEDSSTQKGQMVAQQMGDMSQKGRMRVMSDMMKGAGMKSYGESSTQVPVQRGMFGSSKFRTEMDRNTAIGDYMMKGMGSKEDNEFLKQKVGGATRGEWIGGIAASFTFGAVGKEWAEKKYEQAIRGGEKGGIEVSSEGIGQAMMQEDTQERLKDLLSSDKKVAATALQQTRAEMVDLRERSLKGSLSKAEGSQLAVKTSLLMAQDFKKLVDSGMGADDAAKSVAASSEKDYQRKMSADQVKHRVGAAFGSMADSGKSARRQLWRRAREMGAAEMTTYREGGMMRGGKMSDEYRDALGSMGPRMTKTFKGHEARAAATATDVVRGSRMDPGAGDDAEFTFGGTAGQMYMSGMMGAAQLEETLVENEEGGLNEKKMGMIQRSREGARLSLSQMGNEEMGRIAADARKRGDLGTSKSFKAHQELRRRMTRAGGGVRGTREVGRQFGSSLGARDLMGMDAGGAASALTQDILGKQAAGTDEGKIFQEGMKNVLSLQREGKGGKAADAIKVLRDLSGDVLKEGSEAKQEEKAKRDDPTHRAIVAMKDAIIDLPSKIAGKNLKVVGLQVGLEGIITAIQENL